ncbi:MAG: glycosyltransferase N-terminal domain-containing protein [Pseudomonadota bacterium]
MSEADAPLIWFHVPNESRLTAVEQLADRLSAELPDIRILITVATLPAQTRRGNVTYQSPPGEARSMVVAFLQHWRPAVLVWVGVSLDTMILAEAEAQRVSMFMIDARFGDLVFTRAPWQRMRMKKALRAFSRLLAVEIADADELRYMGARPWLIEVSGPLQAGAIALSHNEAERAFLAEILASRPMWYATDLPMNELSYALDAQAHVLQRAHRFLFVVTPADPEDAEAMAEAARARGLRVVCRSETDEVDPEDQVVIANIEGEHGLWYRLAPLTYMGGTLTSGQNRDPFEPAALGSAIVHGNRTVNARDNFSRLQAAAASRVIGNPADLGPALAALSTPDQSARLAHDAWDVSSRGAQVTDRVVALVTRALKAA